MGNQDGEAEWTQPTNPTVAHGLELDASKEGLEPNYLGVSTGSILTQEEQKHVTNYIGLLVAFLALKRTVDVDPVPRAGAM